jgi:hypothetical protein
VTFCHSAPFPFGRITISATELMDQLREDYN